MMQDAIEPEIIFPDSDPRAKIVYARTSPIIFALKILLTGFVGLFIALVILICFPISALCTMSTIATTSFRVLISHLWGWARGKRLD